MRKSESADGEGFWLNQFQHCPDGAKDPPLSRSRFIQRFPGFCRTFLLPWLLFCME